MGINDKMWQRQELMRAGRSGHAVASWGRWIYQAFGTASNLDVEATYLNTDGSLAPWKVVGTVPAARTNLIQSAQVGNHWIVAGGQVGFQPQTQVWSCALEAGSVSRWREQASLPVETSAAAITANDKFVYVIGGFNGTFPALSTVTKVWMAQPQNGQIYGWKPVSDIPVPTDQGQAFVHGGYLYLFGGQNDNSGVVIATTNWRARISTNGELGKWEQIASLALGPRTRGAAVVHKGKVYIIGGIIGSTNQDTTEVATLTGDGPGRFESGYSLPIPLRGAEAVSVDNHIVLLGGGPGTGNTAFTLLVY